MSPELQNWIGGIAVLFGTVLIQLGAQTMLLRLFVSRGSRGRIGRRGWLRPAWVLSMLTVFTLIVGHFAQVLLWVLLYLALGAFESFSDAAYFALASYTTVGAADLELTRAHRILGAFQAGVGILMFGWSGAILVALIGLTKTESQLDARRER